MGEAILGIREITEPFELDREERGITATRVFFYDPDDTINSTAVPDIGDKFQWPYQLEYTDPSFPVQLKDATKNHLYCVSVDRRVIAGHPQKIEYTCVYSNEQIDTAAFTEALSSVASECELRMEVSGDSNVVTPAEGTMAWKWLSDKTTLSKESIGFRANVQSVRITRYVQNSAYWTFENNVMRLCGSVLKEDNTPWDKGAGSEGKELGSWLFESCRSEKYNNHKGHPTYQCEMIFTRRAPGYVPNGPEYDVGWLKIVRNDLSWDIPQIPASGGSTLKFLYKFGEFDYLFVNSVAPNPTDNASF